MSVNHKIFFDIQSYEEFKRIVNEISGNISREVFGAMPVGNVPEYSCMVAVVDEVIEITARMLDIVWHGGKSPQSFRMEVVEVKSSPLIIIELPRMTEIELPQLPQIMLDFRGSQSAHINDGVMGSEYDQFYAVATHQELVQLVQSLNGVIYKDGIVMGNPSSDEMLLTHYECWIRIGDETICLYAHVHDMATQGGRPVAFSISVEYVKKCSDD